MSREEHGPLLVQDVLRTPPPGAPPPVPVPTLLGAMARDEGVNNKIDDILIVAACFPNLTLSF